MTLLTYMIYLTHSSLSSIIHLFYSPSRISHLPLYRDMPMTQVLENKSARDIFDQLATNGCLGDPAGGVAYCYIRVSSAQQAEEGRTGLPRQIQHCHEVASANRLKIPWDCVFADDGFSGFDFENRPALSRLREEIKTQPRSRHLVIEHIDRLSRNARWHQGFLLDEFGRYKFNVLFWKSFGSEIERAVLGTVAEEGMRSEMARMREGTILKAKSGRVTAKRPRFGYVFVDGDGRVSEKARRDTHYAIDPETANVVRWIFSSIIREHKSLRTVAIEMNKKKIPTRFNGRIWCSGTIWRIISDPIYKGDFYAHRFYAEKTGKFDAQGHPRNVTRERPAEEWIKIQVPAIVSPAEWKLAQEILESNQKRSTRNMKKQNWLLSTFLKCDICRYAFVAQRGGSARLHYPVRYYKCNGRNTERARVNNSFCQSPSVSADKIEAFVWSKVEELVTHPDLFLKLIEESGDDPAAIEDQQKLEYLEGQLAEVSNQYERWKKAYEHGVITLKEYEGYRNDYMKKSAELNGAKKEIEIKIGDRVSKEEQRRLILNGLAELRQGLEQPGLGEEPPFEVKRRLLLQILDCVWVDTEKKTIRFEGVLKSSYQAEDTVFVFGSERKSR